MKKLIIAIACVALTGVATAQKPVEGDVTGEVQLNFQTGTSPINIASPELRARYFLHDDLALRVSLAITNNSQTINVLDPTSGSTKTGKVELSGSTFSIGAGIEKHFGGTTRLSPFVGAAIGFTSGSTSQDWTNATYDATSGASFS